MNPMRVQVLLFFLSFLPGMLFAKSEEYPGRIPDEMESDGGHVLGTGMGGMSAISGQNSVKSNPAMLVFEKQYQLSAGYHWPSFGREFYQAGIVDSKTSSIAAGVTYTSFMDEFKTDEPIPIEKRQQHYYDSPLKNRISLGFGQAFSNFAAGLGVQVINRVENEKDAKRGVTFGFGLAALLNPALRFGLSVENAGNKKVRDIAPLTYRGGLAYTLLNGNLTAHLDYRQRQRVKQELLIVADDYLLEFDGKSGFERLGILSFSVRIQDLLRVLGGYGIEIGGRRSTLSGGLALVNQSFSLSYLLSKPYLDEEPIHQAVNLAVTLNM